MATTTNFGWETPDDTDLVKDGALAIRTLGSAIDTSLVDLKGGTTGQVLSKTSNTDMDFTWVTSDDANAIQNSIINAKGDLIVGSANDTPSILSVSSDGSTLVADSSTSTGLRWQESQAAGKNYVLNGAMDWWQRATTYNLTTTIAYGAADRWAYQVAGGTAQAVASQVTSSLPEGFRYATKLQRNSSSTNLNPIRTYQILETQSSIPLQNKIVTISFWAKAGANYSSSSSALSVRVCTGTGTDQSVTSIVGGLTGYAEVVSTDVTLTTSWQRFTLTSSTISSSATQVGLGFFFTPTGTAGADDSFQITGVQIEVGSRATSFMRAGGTLAGELAACQRYYYRVTGQSAGQSITNGNNESTTVATAFLPFPVTMRTAPTALEQDGTAANYYVRHQATTTNCSSVPTFANGSKTGADISFIVASGLTAGNGNKIGMNSTSAYLGWSAEL